SQKGVGGGVQLCDGFLHGYSRCVIDVNLINAGSIHRGNGPRYGVLAYAFRQNFTAVCEQEFRIAQATNAVSRIQYDRGCNDWSKQRPTADFIYTGHQRCAGTPRQLFVLESAMETLQQAQLHRRCRKLFLWESFSS